MTRPDADPPEDAPLVILDGSSACNADHAHAWPLVFASGDLCRCGAYVLVRASDGTLHVERRRG